MEQAQTTEKVGITRMVGGVAGAVGVAAGVATTVRRRVAARGMPSPQPEDPSRWLVVTVNRPEDDAQFAELPAPLRAWGDAIEVRTATAPGGRGTELAVRLRDPHADRLPGGLGDDLAHELDGETPAQKLRSALRRAKQLVETGEVLRADEPGTAEATALNAPLRAATSDSGAEGRL
jgi:hypothetical protein